MNAEVLKSAADEMARNRGVAIITVTRVSGSTPRKAGALMCVKADGSICGTIGGGKLEATAIEKALECMARGASQEFVFKLTDEPGSLHMQCGGEAAVFVNVMKMRDKLIVFGAGHISRQLCRLAKMLGFHVTIVDDRAELCNRGQFPEADALVVDDLQCGFACQALDAHSFVVIVTRGHATDALALREVAASEAGYIGMIGSHRKIACILEDLSKSGVPADALEKVYAPIGLDLGGDTPEDIAFSILAEIQVIRHGGKLAHLKVR